MNDGAREAEADAQLAASSRRIADLNDIIEMLREASSAPDVESVCDALLKSAVRAVPRAEIVFVALRQPESGDLAAVVSSGLISAEFRYGRGPSGIGLWGQVERLLLPVRTDSYSSDNAFAHDEELDGACRADGVTSAICAPLVVDGAAIGAVYTKGRAAGMFGDGDVTRLAERANAAAPAIHRAVVARDLRASMSEIAESRNRLGRAIAAYDDVAARVVEGAPVADVIDALVSSFDGAVAALAVDASDRELVTAPADSEIDPLRDRWVLDGLSEARRTVAPVVTARGEGTAVFVPAVAEDRHVGTVLVLFTRQVDDTDIRTVQRLVRIFALVITRRPETDGAAGAVNPAPLRGLLTGRGAVSPEMRRRAELAGIDLGSEWIISAVALPPRTDPGTVVRLLRGVDAGADAALLVDGVVVVLTRGDSPRRAGDRAIAVIRRDLGIEPLLCAARVADAEAGGFARRYEEVNAALGLLQSLGRARGVFDVDDFPAHLPLLRSVTVDAVIRFLDDTVGPLVQFDRENSTELVRTVRAYFAANMNVAATARELDLHVNTVIKRLRRVSELLGAHWQSEQESLPLRLALNLHTLAVDGG